MRMIACGAFMRVGGMVMVGAIIANKAPVKLTQTTPIARLTGEYEALVAPAESPFKNAKDLVAALKADPAKVPVCGGSAGDTAQAHWSAANSMMQKKFFTSTSLVLAGRHCPVFLLPCPHNERGTLPLTSEVRTCPQSRTGSRC